ncbi:DUF6470 family protein [Cytobacillus dafuensis]|uniref:YviE n=1 Tax=Cytobacillus dafuensis TaxID=1742359 RepID=A0A5B8ZCU7_CYTDA|nr:DUF6470 family protein [Cytobacillus dafuensis]QED49599.1 hypothetical protein FSZ17_21320 [Cytobacillus dafuensis]
MQLPQLRMQSQTAQLGMDISPPVQSIEQPAAQLDLQQPAAEMYINRISTRLTIDQTAAWESMGIKSAFRSIEENAAQAYQDVLAGMERRSFEGDELMRIENGGNVIANQAERNGEDPIYDFNIGFIPPNFSVKIHFTPGQLNIQWKTNQVINQTRPQKPIIDYQKGDITYRMKQHPSLKIDVVNLP